MSEIKPTPGPWSAHHDHGWLVVESECGSLCLKVSKGSASQAHLADARLIAEAGTVFHNTGLSPVQLVEMVKELKAALGGITAMCEQHGDFRNGVTDPTGTIDEGNVVAGRVIDSARAALAKCEGVGND